MGELYSGWLKRFAPLFHPIRSKTKTNWTRPCIFPRFASATCNYYEFRLVHCIFSVFCDWLAQLLWFWFYDTLLKTALSTEGQFTCNIKGSSNKLSRNRCYGLRLLFTALDSRDEPTNSQNTHCNHSYWELKFRTWDWSSNHK